MGGSKALIPLRDRKCVYEILGVENVNLNEFLEEEECLIIMEYERLKKKL